MNVLEQPLVSILMATYNRSNVIVYAIESVLAQSYEHWELIVVGDACTDDTENVVNAIGDPRIKFINLEHNIGEQSGPNNAGFEHAKGDLIAYLNHDDLWFEDHLAIALEHIRTTKADLVYTLVDFIRRDGVNEIGPISTSQNYDPMVFAPASCWLLKRTCLEDVGPWRFYRSCHLVPSQDWLYRAWKMKKRMCLAPTLTVVAVQSGNRPAVYANREHHENQRLWQAMKHD
ncbi:MAG: glycosyltransferase, partial [Verrucomicrobia bacterium]|nr:glycosyltransferase [Verrucomicrobiota bacterium]